PMATVSGEFVQRGITRTAQVVLEGSQRRTDLDGKTVEWIDNYFEGRVAVTFSPDDLQLVKGPPAVRRRFVDRAAFHRWPAALSEVREYARALKLRNSSLREFDAKVDDSFCTQLARIGGRLWRRRLELLSELEPHIARASERITGATRETARATYR